MSGDLQPGQLVRSIAGRDKGRWLLTKRELDEKFVEVADGRQRSIKKPKKKNKKHLQFTGYVDRQINLLLTDNQNCTDAEVKEAINRLLKKSVRKAARETREVDFAQSFRTSSEKKS